MTAPEHGRHEAPEAVAAPPRLVDDLRDAIAPRTVVLVIGVLVLQLGFILSYIGAFHSPTPHRIQLGVIGPSSAVQQLDALPGEPVRAHLEPSEAAARSAITSG